MIPEFDIAILGVTGAAGRAILELLAERNFAVGNVYLLGSAEDEGENFRFNGKTLYVQDVENFDWAQAQIAFFTAGSALSGQWAPIAADEGVIVIDNSPCYRHDPDVPLVVAEVNPEAIADFRNQNIIANPNCTTVQTLIALKPLYDAVGIERVNAVTYQSVSGSGKAGIDELAGQTVGLLNSQDAVPALYRKQIAFNCLPQIDDFVDNGYTQEEMKLVWETHKILADDSVGVNPTCVRVPVFYGHAIALHIECRQPLDATEAMDILARSEGIEVFAPDDYPTQVKEANGSDNVMIGRIRNDISHPNGLDMWVVADNVRKGIALNMVKIAELLVRDYL